MPTIFYVTKLIIPINRCFTGLLGIKTSKTRIIAAYTQKMLTFVLKANEYAASRQKEDGHD